MTTNKEKLIYLAKEMGEFSTLINESIEHLSDEDSELAVKQIKQLLTQFVENDLNPVTL